MYGSQSELLAQGLDPKQLLGLISHTDVKEERDQFSVNLQDDSTYDFNIIFISSNLFVATTGQEALPGSPSLPASFQSHPKPLSPLVHRHQRGDGLPSSESLSPTVPLSSPSRARRRRHLTEEDDQQQNKLGPELSPFDTASIISMPSMLSLHSHVEGVASWHEEKEVHS